MSGILTIGELAAFVGVTPRTVRHYHARGLLAEPERDSSGYRRYTVQDAIALIRIRTLAEAGVPLARVGELSRAAPQEFQRAVADIDRGLRAEIRRLQQHRRRIVELAAGEALTLPVEVVKYLDRMRQLGLSERMVQIERDAWIILAARAPERVHDWIPHKAAEMEDPEYQSLYRAFDEAHDWARDDPRLIGIADAMDRYVQRKAAEYGVDAADGSVDGATSTLLDSYASASPGWTRLIELFTERRLGRWA